MDDVRLYSRALTSNDNRQLHAINSAPTNITLTQETSVTINNPSFESQQLPDNSSTTSIVDWTNSASTGTVNPPSSWYTHEAPEGENVAFINTNTSGETISQTLAETFQANRSYTLTAMVGDELAAGDSSGWQMRLYAGGVLLGSVSNNEFDPADDSFVKATLHLDADALAASSATPGDALRIEFYNIGDPASVANVHFDDVQLEYTDISVAENSTNGTVVADVSSVTDPDVGDTHTYSLTTNNAGGRFTIDSSTGVITVANSALLDYESITSHDITVRVTDSGGLTYDEVVTLQVTNVNEVPVASADPSNYNATVQGLSPVGYWTLGETSGTAAVDSISANNGTYNGTTGATGAAGAINNSGGNAAEFNGSDDYIEIAHDPAYLLDNGAIQLWFNADNLSAKQTLISKDSSDFDNGGHFYIELLTTGEFKVRLQSATDEYEIFTSGAGITAGNWHHVVLTFGAQGMQLYLDGSKVDSNAYTGGLGTTSGGSGNAEPLVIGANTDGSGDGIATPFLVA
jgi:hypothetical protein